MQRAQRDDGLWEGGQGEQRCYQRSAAHTAPISHHLGKSKLLCTAEHQTHTIPSLPLLRARDGSSSGAVMVDIHSIAAASTQPVKHRGCV